MGAAFSSPLSAFIFCFAGWVAIASVASGRRQNGLPPGPPTYPIVGNLLTFPRKQPHIQFSAWARTYGDIFSLKIMHLTIIVLNSPTAVKELIDKRSLLTANRPGSLIADMITGGLNMGAARCPDKIWKTLRRAAVAMLNTHNLENFKPVLRAEASQLMLDILRNPEVSVSSTLGISFLTAGENFYEDISRLTTSSFLVIIYGHRAARSSSSEAKIFRQLQLDFMNVVEVGKSPPVDLIPALAWVPERYALWKRRVMSVSRRYDALYGELLSLVKGRVTRGQQNGAFMEDAYLRRNELELSDAMLLNLGGTLLAGSDTSSAVLQNLVLLLVAHPEVQAKAQKEVDDVVGHDRPPTWSDMECMPYLRALLEEVNRFRPVGPLALPHAMSQDEWVDGLFFPKGAALFINLWAIFHDERYFANPEKFEPERFLRHPLGVNPDVTDDPGRRENMMFGGGRRVCPGINAGKAAVGINAVNLLWAFDFSPAKDPCSGGMVQPDLLAFTEGVNATPLPFKCTITPRSTAKKEIICQYFLEQSDILAHYEQDTSPEDKDYLSELRSSLRR
ncbi:cytochrome P450 [Paxillus ammoniavirescens]|nr:cytochrome P450 [Paxillus ammoniavirescens]